MVQWALSIGVFALNIGLLSNIVQIVITWTSINGNITNSTLLTCIGSLNLNQEKKLSSTCRNGKWAPFCGFQTLSPREARTSGVSQDIAFRQDKTLTGSWGRGRVEHVGVGKMVRVCRTRGRTTDSLSTWSRGRCAGTGTPCCDKHLKFRSSQFQKIEARFLTWNIFSAELAALQFRNQNNKAT